MTKKALTGLIVVFAGLLLLLSGFALFYLQVAAAIEAENGWHSSPSLFILPLIGVVTLIVGIVVLTSTKTLHASQHN